jgi:Fe-S cluster assembly ATP-binding protein
MAQETLELVDLVVTAGGRRIINGLSLRIGPGEVHVLLGPNGSGKSTLLMAVMGLPGYEIAGGAVILSGKDITSLSADERAQRGLALAFQRPPPVRGVRLGKLAARLAAAAGGGESLAALGLMTATTELLGRDLNVGLSGGEAKRSEMLQLLLMQPQVALFDEPESGVDLDNIAVVGGAMRSILGIGEGRNPRAGLIVTHTGHILREVPARVGHVLLEGTLVCRGDPLVLFRDIGRHGYEGCLTCRSCLKS